MALFCELNSMQTESDVEQKFIYPFLHTCKPIGLGYKDSEILTKHILQQKLIDKGSKRKYYFPDYLVSIRGIPVLVVEAKAPDEDLVTGYYEARLYALEVNAAFPHKLNACQYVIASNGKEIWAGYYDQEKPVYKLNYDECTTENVNYHYLLELCSNEKIIESVNRIYADIRGKAKYNSPVSQLGGKRVQNEEMVENSFGSTLVFENRNIFDPETEADRKLIVKNAYITSAKREQHMDPIYKEIKRFELPNQVSNLLQTNKPDGLIEKLSEKVINKQEAYSLMLLIGNVGSGKTTFIRYFKDVILEGNHKELASKCEWIFINMNTAPVYREEIYDWIQKSIIQQIKEELKDIDIDNIETIKKIFRREVNTFDKGIGSLLKTEPIEYNKELYKTLRELINNTGTYLTSLLFFVKENYAKIPIIVLDNCDKRNKDDQLLMFEVSQWLRTQFKCIVILPMRDTTYDIYKHVPPLDTIVRDLVFRIDPPDLLKVLQARLDYIIRITDLSSDTYVLDNNMKVAIKRGELIEYLKLIMSAIRADRWISDIFYRLTNKNIRNGIQLFEDFCKSGHMKTNDILSIRMFGEEASIPSYKFMNVILRKNRRYYNGEESYFANVFSSDYDDGFPDPFIRLDILNWLQIMRKHEGPNKEKGLFKISTLERDLQIYGHDISVIQRELRYLISKGLVFCDNLDGTFEDNDLITITIPGALHLNIVSNVLYLAACAEDTLFKNTEIMMRISDRLMCKCGDSKLISILNAKDLLLYLIDYRKQYITACDEIIKDNTIIAPYDLCQLCNVLDGWIDKNPTIKKSISALEKYVKGVKVEAQIINKSKGGLVCFLDEEETKGFCSIMNDMYNLQPDEYEKKNVGDIINCEIIDYDYVHNSFQLKNLENI